MGRSGGCGRSDLIPEVAESESPAPDDENISERRVDLSARAAIWAFAAVEAGAFVFYLVLARSEWFFLDEWDFLAGRGIGAHDLLRAHAGHWVAVPVVVYRVLWWAVVLGVGVAVLYRKRVVRVASTMAGVYACLALAMTVAMALAGGE